MRDVIEGSNAESGAAPDSSSPDKADLASPEGYQELRDRNRTPHVYLVFSLVLALAFALQLGMVTPARFGEAYDDTIYVTAAKSLATGSGYQLINLPEPVAQTLIPPLYPFVLSLIWRVYPHFPDNLLWMMLLTAVAMIGFLGLTWRYLVEHHYATPWQATALVALAGINWRMMTLTTSILSEVVFALFTVATLFMAERYQKADSGWRAGALLGVVAGLSFLTRSSGLVLIIAAAFYFVLHRKWNKVLLPVAVASLFVIAWLGWGYLNKSAGGGEHASYYAGYTQGIDSTLDQLQALNGSSRLTTHLKIIETNALGLILVWVPLQGYGLRSGVPLALLVPFLLFSLVLLVAGVVREVRKGLRLLHIYLGFYLALHLSVPSHSYERYLMPILPFLLFFVIKELVALVSTLKSSLISSPALTTKLIAAAVGLMVAAAASIPLYSNLTGIYLSLTTPRQSEKSAAQEADAFEWIKANTDPSDVLVCFGDQKYYLYTGRKVVRSIPVNLLDLVVYQEKDPDPSTLIKVFLNIVDENRATYLVLGAKDFEDQAPAYGRSVGAYVDQHPEQFVPEYRFSGDGGVIYRIRRTLNLSERGPISTARGGERS